MAREGTRSGRKRSATPTTTTTTTSTAPPPVEETKTNVDNGDNTKTEPPRHPLARGTEGMNRRSLLTGIYGSRGERIRHLVANGALLMPAEALDIMASFGGEDNSDSKGQPVTKGKKRKTHQLPGLESVVRPSVDPTLKRIVVTDVFHKHFAHATDPTQPPSLRTVAANRFVDLVVSNDTPDAERIRGGGDEENPSDVTQPNQSAATSETPAPIAESAATIVANPSTSTTEGMQAAIPAPASVANPIASQVVVSSSEKPSEATGTTPQPQAPAPATQPTTAVVASAPAATIAPAPATFTTSVTSAPLASAPATAPTPAPASATSTGPTPAVTSSSAAAPEPSSTTSTATPTKPTSSVSPVPPASAVKPAEAAEDKVIPLAKKTDPHWEQHIPSANDENLTDPHAKSNKPDWYDPCTVSNLERTLLPEWFDESASHRSEETYLKARETMIHISKQLGNRYVTSTLARRSLPGDVGSLHRLHNFLTSYLWINEEGRNDSAPTAPSLQQPPQMFDKEWNDKRRGDLIEAVVEAAQQQRHANKKQKTTDAMEVDDDDDDDDDDEYVAIDWNLVGKKVGASAGECEREFLSMQLDETSVATTTEPPATPDAAATEPARSSHAKLLMSKDQMAQDELVRSLVEESSPRVIRKVTEAALIATNHDLPAAQKAARLGLIASQAAQAAQGHEETVSRLLTEVLDQRMQKLECRMALMDDLEGMLEAERVALELERRDLYTTRCRDWFGNS